MFVVLSGYPFSGKSTFVSFLHQKLLDRGFGVLVLDPKLFTSGTNNLSKQEISNLRISAWEACLDELRMLILNGCESVVIFDSSSPSAATMAPLFREARRRKDAVVYIFISSPIAQCAARAGDCWLSEEDVEYYTKKFEGSVSELKSVSDLFFWINNKDGDLDHLRCEAAKVAKSIAKHALYRVL